MSVRSILILVLVVPVAAGLAFWGYLSFGAPESQTELSVPSGQEIHLQEVITNQRGPSGLTARFRFVAPEVEALDLQVLSDDMEHICNNYAVQHVALMSPPPRQVIISISQVPTEFGASTPQIVKFFEAYSIVDNTCIWEGF